MKLHKLFVFGGITATSPVTYFLLVRDRVPIEIFRLVADIYLFP